MKKNILYIVIILIVISNLSVKAQPYEIGLRAVAAFEVGNFALAENLFDEASKMPFDQIGLVKYRAQNYRKQQKNEQALALYTNASASNAGFYSFEIAECYALLGNATKAVEFLKTNRSSNYKKSVQKIRNSSAFGLIENTEIWRKFMVELKSNYTEDVLAKASYAIRYEKPYEAIDLLEQVLKTTENKEVGLQLAKAYLLSGKPAEALKLLKSSNLASAEYYELLAEAEQKTGNYEAALQSIFKLKAIEPYQLSHNLTAANLALKLKNFELATGFADTFLLYFPAKKEALLLKAEVCMQSESMLAALQIYNSLLSKEPINNELLICRGKAYSKTTTWQRAETDFSMALDVNPKQGEVFYLRGVARINQRKTAEACMDWKQAQRLNFREATAKLQQYCE
ncbi:MAG TPA: hypothetical protein DCQ31_07630 [Bacteroidales bacterium]|nr:hypothetical protein [Bacteroidales bacterium]